MEYPYFPFYVKDWIIGTANMNPTEKGGYLNLLVYEWDKGGLPNDKNELAEISGVKNKSLDKIIKKFKANDIGLLINEKLEKVRAEVVEKYNKNRVNGANGGRPKKEDKKPIANPSLTHGLLKQNPSLTQPEPNGGGNKNQIENKNQTNTSVLGAHPQISGDRPDHAPTWEAVCEIFFRMDRMDEAKGFFEYYEALGWMAGNTRIVNAAPFASRWLSNPTSQKKQQQHVAGRIVVMLFNGGEVRWSEKQYEDYLTNPAASGYTFDRYEV
jgi:uncharacterized protein YdaU (DUF1376 family)